jgi:hypothetical protein
VHGHATGTAPAKCLASLRCLRVPPAALSVQRTRKCCRARPELRACVRGIELSVEGVVKAARTQVREQSK